MNLNVSCCLYRLVLQPGRDAPHLAIASALAAKEACGQSIRVIRGGRRNSASHDGANEGTADGVAGKGGSYH
jgi:hypothetical protein